MRGRKQVLVACAVVATGALSGCGDTPRDEALAVFQVSVAEAVPAFASYRFSVDGRNDIPARQLTPADPRAPFVFGYYMPGITGQVVVVARALTAGGCVVGQASATVTVVAGQASPPTHLVVAFVASSCDPAADGGLPADAGAADVESPDVRADVGGLEAPPDTQAAEDAPAADTLVSYDVQEGVAPDAPMREPDAPASDALVFLDVASPPTGINLAEGQACTQGSDCASKFCVDGVCCESACQGQCQACGEAGKPGKCVTVEGTPRSARPACSGQGACAGKCDGSKADACIYPGASVECGAPACTNDTATPRALCGGMGTCVTSTPIPCGGLGCDGSSCRGGCSVEKPCAAGEFCESARCFAARPNGGTCTGNAQCASGQCILGVCCDRACGGQCESCQEAGKVGTCSPRQQGIPCRAQRGPCDLAESCDGVGGTCPADVLAGPGTTCRGAVDVCDQAETCDGSGANCPSDQYRTGGTPCRPALADCDVGEVCSGTSSQCPPDGVHPATTPCRPAAGDCDLAETCSGTTKTCPSDGFRPATTVCRAAGGSCDLAENCTGSTGVCPADAFKTAGTTCLDASCTGNSFAAAKTCSGSTASCPPASPMTCGNYACTTAGCKTSCTAPTAPVDCVSTSYCSGSACVPKIVPPGACTSTAQCLTGACTTFYTDSDHDGFGVSPTAKFCGSSPPNNNWATVAGDCCDTDGNAFPGQTEYFPDPVACTPTGYDFNCSGGAGPDEPKYTSFGNCSNSQMGWWGTTVPLCGETRTWTGKRTGLHSCSNPSRKQPCR